MLAFGLNIVRLLRAIGRSWHVPTFRSILLLAFLILLSGTIFYRSIERWSWVDALYFSATTVSTVGFGELSPATDLGKLFTIIYMFIGIGVFVLLFTQLAKSMLKLDDREDE
ncbi:potassium channel family protein [Hoeflea sp. WL0058]|uniref:Potassium channel family protein n=1 Tax=Flavimaribacter sediminis TaxID=2865987 RepID=A0AAE3D3P8_9HYPH|nr:potassium channel family protein [Flavimaribacter sediminis]MBW8640056.1 potassium channel family protein [Flavimaribacter sediminis]